MNFSQRIKELREARGLSQEQLADILDVPRGSIGHYEVSDTRLPRQERLQKIAEYFNVSIDYLMGRSELNLYERHKELKASTKIFFYFLDHMTLVDYYEVMKNFDDFDELRFREIMKLVDEDETVHINSYLTDIEKKSFNLNIYSYLNLINMYASDFGDYLLLFYNYKEVNNDLIIERNDWCPGPILHIIKELIKEKEEKGYKISFLNILNSYEKALTPDEIIEVAEDLEDYYKSRKERIIARRKKE